MSNTQIELHPLCTLFPRLSGYDYDCLKMDIKEHGQREPIIIHDGMILDGGNRYRACIDLGIEPQAMQFAGDSIASYVLSANLHRRHLTPGQQAAIVSCVQDWAKAQVRGGNGSNQHKVAKVQDCTLATAKDRANQSGASLRTQKQADKLVKERPELAKQVAQGEKTLPKAVEELTGKRTGRKSPVEPKPEDQMPDARDMRIEELEMMLEAVRDENERLNILLAAGGCSDEDRTEFLYRMNDLAVENKHLRSLNAGLIVSRDGAMTENNSMRRELTRYAKKVHAADKAARK